MALFFLLMVAGEPFKMSKKPLKGLIVGFANEQSIAWGCIQAFDSLGAEMAVTYLNEKTRQYTEPLIIDCSLARPTIRPFNGFLLISIPS